MLAWAVVMGCLSVLIADDPSRRGFAAPQDEAVDTRTNLILRRREAPGLEGWIT